MYKVMPASLLLSLLLVHPLLGFEFLIEDGHTSFTSSVGMKELMLEVKIAVTSTTLSKLITTGTTTSVSMVTFMGKLTDTSVGTGIKRLIKKSTTHLVGISSIGNALLKYLTPTSNEPNSPDCFLSYSLVSDEDLETTEIILKKEWSQILDTWTEAELKADSKKFNTVNSVMIIIESELRDVYSKLLTSLNTIDSLYAGVYPPNLYGMYYGLTCLGVIKNEELYPLPCISYSKSVRCPIEIWHPSTVQQLPTFVPVNYNGIQLVGPNNEEKFVKSPLGSHYQVLHCQKSVKHSHSVCQLNRLDQNCETGLIDRNLPRIVKNCKFGKIKPASSIRLADNSILIMDKTAKVKVQSTLGETQVMTNVPYKIQNAKEITVESEGLAVKYTGTTSTSQVSIINSTVPISVLETLFERIQFADYYENLMMASIFDYSLLGLQAIIGIIFAVIFCQIMVLRRRTVERQIRPRSSQMKLLKRSPRPMPLRTLPHETVW
ncbi:MAG: hypothetical protein IV298_15755 [Cylindrospermopsis raciborskii KL1]|uniref:hypothetical protein n=1 Tax=Cylindrospermopsis raciborskii TaxID=77022 RepID=UPI001A26F6AD|nr:hypothetical protein [Cylindrospermopsis raciborskii]MBG0744887.1 hypothetical protein [Cylindrospermopsis raciborskii KL1]